MGARDRAEDRDQDNQYRASRNGVAEKRDRGVSSGKGFRHDARANDCGEQQGSAKCFGGQSSG